MTDGVECFCMAIVWTAMLVFIAWPVAFALNVVWILFQVRDCVVQSQCRRDHDRIARVSRCPFSLETAI
jgi:hypothetical protein